LKKLHQLKLPPKKRLLLKKLRQLKLPPKKRLLLKKLRQPLKKQLKKRPRANDCSPPAGGRGRGWAIILESRSLAYSEPHP
jgi:hypothetical protein